MKIPKFIEKAIEGGYDKYALTEGFEVVSHVTVTMPNNYFVELYDGSDVHISAILLDPLAWQAVERTLRSTASDATIQEYAEHRMVNMIKFLNKGLDLEKTLHECYKVTN